MRRAVVVVLCCVALLGATAVRLRAEVVVSGASSLSDVLSAIALAFEHATGERMVVNLAGSNTLARQIAAGARVDLFISADEAQMDRVARHLAPGTRVALLHNQLAVAVPVDRAHLIRKPSDLAGPQVRRIAIGDPATVPAGVYAQRYLERQGLWAAVQPKLVPTASVRLALAAVASGSADAAIVYRTDLRGATQVRETWAVAADEAPPITYPAAVVSTGRNPAGGRRLLAFLRGPEATALFRQAGFTMAQQ